MRIDGLSLPLARSLLAALPKAVPSFALIEGETRPAQPMTAAPTCSMTSVQMLVTLAAAQDGVERRRRVAREASRGLDALDRLHDEMLAGAPSIERLREIAHWAQSAEAPEDPALAKIFREIDLRVRVELAKYDVEI
ncbi:MAG: flagellar assembly protein FliX [Pseudomonadota bacterium]